MIEANELKSGIPGQTYIDNDGVLKDDTGNPIDKEQQLQLVMSLIYRIRKAR